MEDIPWGYNTNYTNSIEVKYTLIITYCSHLSVDELQYHTFYTDDKYDFIYFLDEIPDFESLEKVEIYEDNKHKETIDKNSRCEFFI